jgi:hypothetical protein
MVLIITFFFFWEVYSTGVKVDCLEHGLNKYVAKI